MYMAHMCASKSVDDANSAQYFYNRYNKTNAVQFQCKVFR